MLAHANCGACGHTKVPAWTKTDCGACGPLSTSLLALLKSLQPRASLPSPCFSFLSNPVILARCSLGAPGPSIAPLSSPPLSAPPMPYSAGHVQSATFSALDSSRSLWLTMKAPHCQFIQEGDGFFTPTSGRSQLCQDIGTPITGFFQTIREQTCAIVRHEVYAGLLLSG